MKRLMKIMVAAVTSVCMLAINLPLTALDVRADGNSYQLSNSIVDDGNGSREEACLTVGNNEYYNTPENLVLEPGTINVQMNTGNDHYVGSFKIELDGVVVLNTSDSADYTLSRKVKVEELRIASDPGEGNPDPSPSYVYLRLATVYSITVTSDIFRTIEIKGSDAEHNLLFATLCNDSGRNGIFEHTYTYEVYERPTQMIIDNPGGVGGEDLLRLTGVTINGQAQQIRNRYDRCVYDLPADTTEFNIVLRCDNTPGRVVEWVNSNGDNRYCPNIADNEVFRHGSARIVGVYAGDDINNLTNVSADYDLTNGCVNEHGCGTLRVEQGYWIAFEFTPDPGYQLWSFQEKELSVQISSSATTNTYLFRVRNGNVHFIAEFRDAESFVTVEDGTMINGGDVTLNDFEVAEGSARINVQPQNGDAYADDQSVNAILEETDLEIRECVNIDLDQVFHVANTEDDYWVTDSYHDLGNGSADITLRMSDDFYPESNDIVLIHDRGEGEADRYETINAQYDPNTNEITFRTNGFSNYMIAAAPNGDTPPEHNDAQEGPHYVLDQTPNGLALIGFGYDEERDESFDFECDLGFTLENDAIIDTGDMLPEGADIKIDIDGTVTDYRPGYCPGNWVMFDGITENGNTITLHLTRCWIVRAEICADVEITVNGEDGELLPIGESNTSFYPLQVDVDESCEEPREWIDLVFDQKPVEVVVRGNDYLITDIFEVDENDLSPIGDNVLPFPDNDGCMWFYVNGIPRGGEDSLVINTPALSGATFTVEGSAGDRVLVVQGFENNDIPEDIAAAINSHISSSTYTDAVYLYGFDIYLVDGTGIVSEPGYSVTVTLQLAQALDLEDGASVFFVHMHQNGTAVTYEIIEGTYNATDRTVTFTTASFSPFVMYKGNKVQQTTTSETTTPETTTTSAPTETTADPASTTAETPAATPVAASAQAQTQAARTGEGRSFTSAIGTILILSAAAVALYDRKRIFEEE